MVIRQKCGTPLKRQFLLISAGELSFTKADDGNHRYAKRADAFGPSVSIGLS
jgi:hypothetical protein